MKALWTALVLLASSLPALAEVSKEEVRRLLDAHVSEQTIISYVQRNGPMEALSVEDLGDLKGAGASDTLLQALIQAQTSSSYNQTPSTDSTPYTTGSSTVVYESPQYYYYPSSGYPTYSYSYPAPYYSTYYPYPYYPYRYYSSYPYRYYPNRYYSPTYYGHSYQGHSGYYGTPHHGTTVTTPRTPVQSGGVNVYRQSPQPRTVTPRTVAPQPSTPHPQAPVQRPSAPRGGGGVPRR